LFVIHCQTQRLSGIVTSKFDPSGQLLWERHIGSANGWLNLMYDVCTDSESNVYIVGESYGGIYFGENLLPAGLFVAKYSPEGSLLWAKPILGASMSINKVVADSQGDCYVLGWFNNLIIADDYFIEYPETSENVFVIKYDEDGNVVWLKGVLGRDYWIRPEDISINEKYGHLYITGTEDSLKPKSNDSKLILAKFDLYDCKLMKEITIAHASPYPKAVYQNAGFGIANNDSSIYITGSLKNNKGGSYIYLAKLDTTLIIIWDKQFCDEPAWNIGYDVALDDENNVYISGKIEKDVTFGNQTLVVQDGQDLFIAKLTNDGQVLWAKSAGSTARGYQGWDIGYSICYDHKNSIYVSGHAGDSAKFPSESQTQARGPFFAKFNKNGDFEYAKSFDNGHNMGVDDRASGFVSCNKDGNLYFATSYLDSIKLGVSPTIREATAGKAYPNPCHSYFMVNLGSQAAWPATLTLTNMAGQTVKEASYSGGEVNVAGLPPGVYVLRLRNGNQEYREKLVIQ
jgi:hypothetical protein